LELCRWGHGQDRWGGLRQGVDRLRVGEQQQTGLKGHGMYTIQNLVDGKLITTHVACIVTSCV